MKRLANIAPALALLALVIGGWWLAVIDSRSVIFPTLRAGSRCGTADLPMTSRKRCTWPTV
jgi:hypothetical protein